MDRATLLKSLRVPGPTRPSIERVYVLMYRADGVGGVARTVLNLANRLAERHEVELISVYRRHDRLEYDLDPRVRTSYLLDARPPARAAGHRGLWLPRHQVARRPLRGLLDTLPPRTFPPPLERHMSALTDLLLLRKLKRLRPGALISTRPSLHAAVAKLVPPHLITIAQDHLNFETRSKGAAWWPTLVDSYRRLDCLVVLTKADVADYQRVLNDDTHVAAIPNAIPWLGTETAPLSSKTIVSGGRLVEQKGFDRLIAAYAPVAAVHPDWQLHIYGDGPQHDRLQQRIDALGVGDNVRLQGYVSDFPARLADAAGYAMTSRFEGFPMVLVEAMSKGLPLVSFDCPRGPAEIIDDGVNGFLVDNGDTVAFTQALLRLIEDDEGRRRMGAAALVAADKYTVTKIVGRWENLLDELLERRRSTASVSGRA